VRVVSVAVGLIVVVSEAVDFPDIFVG